MQRQKSFENNQPTLYLVATPIGNLNEMTFRSVDILKNVDYIAAEDTRNTIKLLNHFDIHTRLISHHEHNLSSSIPKLIQLLLDNHNIALVSDAGYPAISDPGYELVQECIKNDINVVPISGCNACLDALVVSGLAPQPFLFYGFLSRDNKTKKDELIHLSSKEETFVLYEAPHRIKKTLQLMLEYLGDRNICLAREITKKHEEINRGKISEILECVDDMKGEMVIVVEGTHNNSPDKSFEDSPIEAVNKLVVSGISSKEAIKQISKERNISKNDLYNEYHKN